MKVILSLCDFTGNWSRPYCQATNGYGEEPNYLVRRVDI